MPGTVEERRLHRVVEELRSVVASLQGRHGDVPAVRRLKNDLERLELDVHDVGALGTSGPLASPAMELSPLTDEPYDPAMWAEDADDEGLGGYHGASRR
jgi:hypothetical protein